jgi:hypothetical protein
MRSSELRFEPALGREVLTSLEKKLCLIPRQ